jgi:hypothetical protein
LPRSPPCPPSGGWAGHLTAWPAITTLLRDKRRTCTTCPSHVDTRSPAALVRPPGPNSRAGLAPWGERSLQRGSCMVPAPYISNGMLAARFPLKGSRRGSSAGTISLQQVVGHPWVFPNQGWSSMGVFLARRQDPKFGFPFPTESGLECEPSFGLAPLAGRGHHVANYLECRPFIVYRCVLVRTNIATNTAQPIALYRDRSCKDRPRFHPPGFHPFPYYPTSV